MDSITFDPELYDTLYEFSQISKKNDERIKEIIENSTFKLSPAITEAIGIITKKAFENLKINANEIIESGELSIPDSQFQKIGQIQTEAWKAAVKAIEPAMESLNKRFKELELESESNAVLDKETTQRIKDEFINFVEESNISPENKEEIKNCGPVKTAMLKEDWTQKEVVIYGAIFEFFITLIFFVLANVYNHSSQETTINYITINNNTTINNYSNNTVIDDSNLTESISEDYNTISSLPDGDDLEKDDSHEQDADSLQSDSDSSLPDDSEGCDQEEV